MPQLLRIPVDLVIPDDVSRPQVEEITNMVKDYAGSVAGNNVLNRTIVESNPGATWHIHDGKTGCDYCQRAYGDSKNADDPRGEN